MPKLDCSVTNCRYNKEHGCIRDHITVGGTRAKEPKDTCCDSFEERRMDSYSNSLKEPSEHVGIQCEACSCVYNEACSCKADHIVVGGAGSYNREDTLCGTYDRRGY